MLARDRIHDGTIEPFKNLIADHRVNCVRENVASDRHDDEWKNFNTEIVHHVGENNGVAEITELLLTENKLLDDRQFSPMADRLLHVLKTAGLKMDAIWFHRDNMDDNDQIMVSK
jgi:hypothetical protein